MSLYVGVGDRAKESAECNGVVKGQIRKGSVSQKKIWVYSEGNPEILRDFFFFVNDVLNVL